jgi:acetyl-CoA/propionyl-CoA/long-chain acyl-CoA carboxylase, biotin carboxylase, biotin carboxyl carrier protein
MTVFRKILIANRGEIAVRVIRACRELGIASVAVYSDADRQGRWVRAADEAVHIGPTPAAQSYLDVERILIAAKSSGCDALHPGYGFLAENAAFARACAQAGVTFIGPSPAAMEQMGGKLAARAVAMNVGVPVVPGTVEPVKGADAVRALAKQFGYPIAIKASAGGGGKGLKVASTPDEVDQAVSLASKEAQAYFADPTLYVERYLPNPKHVEIQVLGDRHGNAVHFGERDCSLQRRHQKLIEETPARIGEALRARMGEAAVGLAAAIGYDSAGTIECLVEKDEFFFLEMNTRIQVEHTITEAAYGFDLVKAQIRIAAGEKLWQTQAQLRPRGHAIEVRVNAESPAAAFAPSPGRITQYAEPGGPGIRVDSAAFAGWRIGSDYDSLVAKLVSWGEDREEARHRMLRALDEYVVEGITTTIPFYRLLLDEPSFITAEYSTSTVERFVHQNVARIASAYDAPQVRAVATATGPRADEDTEQGDPAEVTVEVNDKRFHVRVYGLPAGPSGAVRRAPTFKSSRTVAYGGLSVVAPMHGIVAEVKVQPGDLVADGQVVAVIEAMKMMNEVVAHRKGTVASVAAKAGESIETGAPLVIFAEPQS